MQECDQEVTKNLSLIKTAEKQPNVSWPLNYNQRVLRKDTMSITYLWAYLADNKSAIFSLVFQKTGYDISCNLSSKETIGMKCQNLFLENC